MKTSDLISRAELDRLLVVARDDGYITKYEYDLFRELVGRVPSTNAVQEWIPCSERLPDIKEHHVSAPCLVYCENGAYGFAELEENIFGQVGWNCEREDDYHEPLGEVVAWMPLPEPYEGGESDE